MMLLWKNSNTWKLFSKTLTLEPLCGNPYTFTIWFKFCWLCLWNLELDLYYIPLWFVIIKTSLNYVEVKVVYANNIILIHLTLKKMRMHGNHPWYIITFQVFLIVFFRGAGWLFTLIIDILTLYIPYAH